jgi:C4-dicarboxylate transporter DctM subunit
MSIVTIGYIALVTLLVLLVLGVPIAWSMAIIGVAGELYFTGLAPTAAQINMIVWDSGTSFVFVALPLFLVMGQIAFRTGITDDLYDCIQKWFGHLPGGLAVAAVLANTIYGAVTGNSIASVATLGPIVMPEFRKHKYNLSLATGTLASAGTLAILVPPSTGMIIYGVWTETSIGDLFLAGVLPCLILAIAYCLVLALMCKLYPELGPRGQQYSWSERFRSLYKLLPAAILIGVVLGGIYGGIMTPSESAGIGVVGTLLIALCMRRLSWAAFRDAQYASLKTSGMVFCLLISGVLFGRFMVHTNVTVNIVHWIGQLGLSQWGLLISLMVFYIILGAALDTWAMLILSLPFVMPVIVSAGIDKVWFGVFVAIMVELAAVSPPVGITVAVMRNVSPDVSTQSIFRGCYPFIILTILLTLLLIAFPQIALWLPQAAR